MAIRPIGAGTSDAMSFTVQRWTDDARVERERLARASPFVPSVARSPSTSSARQHPRSCLFWAILKPFFGHFGPISRDLRPFSVISGPF